MHTHMHTHTHKHMHTRITSVQRAPDQSVVVEGTIIEGTIIEGTRVTSTSWRASVAPPHPSRCVSRSARSLASRASRSCRRLSRRACRSCARPSQSCACATSPRFCRLLFRACLLFLRFLFPSSCIATPALRTPYTHSRTRSHTQAHAGWRT